VGASRVGGGGIIRAISPEMPAYQRFSRVAPAITITGAV
jgi:hypothetical protein